MVAIISISEYNDFWSVNSKDYIRGEIMSNNFNDTYINESDIGAAMWDNLLEMADSYEEYGDISDMPVYDNINFYESSKAERKYDTPKEALKGLFGYDSFRAGQKEVIHSILSGRDVFAVMPTGAGKSVCYQIPAMLLSGITLVISPLISLMQDQVKALNEAGIPAAFINSMLSENAFYETVRRARQGVYKIIYVAPERLVTEGFLGLAKSIRISMVTVDEAHCISQWGQDFRPSYMKIVEFVRQLDNRPVISAFTATATENVREDIVCTLGLVNPYILVNGFNRENLFFQVDRPKNKEQYILDYIAGHAGESGIIYCTTRKNVDNLYELLRSKGISVGRYHAGLSITERKQMQDDFVFDYTSIIVATNAFGMGIDKSNVRFVIHYNMPQSMENYYQEAGRAGRDGLESKCILLFSPQDIIINRFLLDHKEMAELYEADRETVKERDAMRLQIMERYCYTTECLRNYILKYFGENPQKPCGDCGNCLREFETLDMTDEAKKIINCVYEAKSRYGKGIIIDIVYGAKTARLEEIKAEGYKSYGILSSVNKKLLKRLIEQLVLEGYLIVGDYQVIKMGNISGLKNPETKVLVKITDDDKMPEKAAKPKTKEKAKGMASLTSDGFKVFDNLKKLRLQIAREENMPPYIVFSDKTLIDMAAKMPLSQQEMLNVSGVGERKYVKYGEKFLAVIKQCTKTQEYTSVGIDKKPDVIADIPNDILKRPEYDFIRINEHLGKHVILLGLAGSYSYGTNIVGSDIDIRGITLNSKSDLIGLTRFEQYVDDNTDTVIYAFNKMITLLLNCNPNTIELLGLNPENYLYLNDYGHMLLDNKQLFLSRRAIQSFGGYADAQLRRLQNALARDDYSNKDDLHLNKQAMHLIRLFLMALDILEKGEINTYRSKEHDLLMDIRAGKYQKEDGTFQDSFYGMISEFEKRLQYAADNTDLPQEPDMKKVQDLVMTINERVVRDEI